jgi:glycosyltransferase involved in cell wall biosynthesis
MKTKFDYAFFAPLDGLGGVELQIVDKAAEANRRGFGAFIICPEGSKIEQLARAKKIQIENLNLSKSSELDIAAAFKLSRLIKKYKSKYLIVAQFRHLGIAITARTFFHSNLTVVFYQQTISGKKKIDFYHNWIFKNLDGAITLTDLMKDKLVASTIIHNSKVKVIPYGIHTDIFYPKNYDKKALRAKYNLPEDAFIIGYVARMDWIKDQKTALKAFQLAEIDNSVLALAGEFYQRDYIDQLKALAKEKGMDGKVRFIDFTHDIHELMNCFDLFLTTSLSETFGLVTAEAMAAELPVIATEGEAHKGLVSDYENGLLFPTGDSSECADKILELYNNAELRKVMGERSRKIILDRFEYETQTKEFFNFCEYLRNLRNIKK